MNLVLSRLKLLLKSSKDINHQVFDQIPAEIIKGRDKTIQYEIRKDLLIPFVIRKSCYSS
jgi:hypothetical protein